MTFLSLVIVFAGGGLQAKKIIDPQFDKLPLRDFGKAQPSNWWKALGSQLIYHGI